MKLPVSFDQFKKSPIAAIAFLLVMVVGYLYLDANKKNDKIFNDYENRIEKLESDEKELENKLDEINEKLLECLSIN
jgi:peptidoglycan hydrolase CwlO-like protein